MATIFGLEPARAAEPQPAPWGEMSWLVEDRSAPGVGLSVARMAVAPGATSPAHRHPNCHEIIHLISGSVEQTAGDQRYRMAAGDTVVVAPGQVHHTRNLSGREAAELLICYSAGTRIYQPEPQAP
jgi:quercetin dioxygenase-like cupin family protein